MYIHTYVYIIQYTNQHEFQTIYIHTHIYITQYTNQHKIKHSHSIYYYYYPQNSTIINVNKTILCNKLKLTALHKLIKLYFNQPKLNEHHHLIKSVPIILING
ncbi:unnamed protein product [Spodoptera exigua]|nr:unnamed protein product [Spodoptera exigua]